MSHFLHFLESLQALISQTHYLALWACFADTTKDIFVPLHFIAVGIVGLPKCTRKKLLLFLLISYLIAVEIVLLSNYIRKNLLVLVIRRTNPTTIHILFKRRYLYLMGTQGWWWWRLFAGVLFFHGFCASENGNIFFLVGDRLYNFFFAFD